MNPSPIRIGIYGLGEDAPGKGGIALWENTYQGVITAADAEPVTLSRDPEKPWEDMFRGIHGLVFSGWGQDDMRELADQESMCLWCRDQHIPILAIDEGMVIMNAAFGGTTFRDLPRDLPDALQHRHRPEKGVRHAMIIEPRTELAKIYGEGEIIVNSEHWHAVDRIAKGFSVSARALDGVVEGIEWTADDWFALGVQWQPASSTASGLDIQLFRALVDQCGQRTAKPVSTTRRLAMSA